eukprot:365031-Chlamydomonas_euryale.AAC.2
MTPQCPVEEFMGGEVVRCDQRSYEPLTMTVHALEKNETNLSWPGCVAVTCDLPGVTDVTRSGIAPYMCSTIVQGRLIKGGITDECLQATLGPFWRNPLHQAFWRNPLHQAVLACRDAAGAQRRCVC